MIAEIRRTPFDLTNHGLTGPFSNFRIGNETRSMTQGDVRLWRGYGGDDFKVRGNAMSPNGTLPTLENALSRSLVESNADMAREAGDVAR